MNLVRDSPLLSTLASITVLQPIFYVLQQTNHWMFMGYSLVPFCLFTWDKWMKVFSSHNPLPSIPCPVFLAQGWLLIPNPAFLFTGVQVYLFLRPRLVLHLTAGAALHSQSSRATERKAKKSRITAKR